MIRGKLNFVTGGQYGSEGKGKVAGYLARLHDVEVSICSFGSQAGHTFYSNGAKVLVQQVPMAVVNPNTDLLISQGAIIDPDILDAEIKRFDLSPDRLYIHPKAAIIEQRHKDYEASKLTGPKRIASTCKGNGAAMAEYVSRDAEMKTVDMIDKYKPYICDTTQYIHEALSADRLCMAETAQGFSLDIYQGFYPFTTSRGCTPAAELARIGVSQNMVGDVYGVYRTYPIRVGNIVTDEGVTEGFSGVIFPDQYELTWEDITRLSGSSTDILERTTVTNRVRRVFTFSREQYKASIDIMGVNKVCVMFMDYINMTDAKCNSLDKLSRESKQWIIDNLLYYYNEGDAPREISLLGTGPDDADMIDVCIDINNFVEEFKCHGRQ